MKKIALSLAILSNLALLSGCTLNWNGAKYDVPWWFALLFAIPFVVLGAVLIINDMPRNFYARCSKCYTRFYVTKRVMRFTSHSPEDSFEFVTKCPCCKKRTLCQKSYDQKEE